jgi:DNA-binding SARP family transcriptional activator
VCRVLGVTAPEDLAARLAGDGGAGSKVGWFISILGRCRVRRDGVDLPVPAGRAGTLLQLLATLGDRATLDEVIEHLWPEVDAEVGRTRIRNVLTRLRHRRRRRRRT